MGQLDHLAITVAGVLLLLVAEHFTPQMFFWLMFAAARHTPLRHLMVWRTYESVYYTNNLDEGMSEQVADEAEMREHLKWLGGLAPPRNLGAWRLVREELTIVSIGTRCVGWSSRTPSRMRIFGFLHDGHLLYGAWYDWRGDSRYRGVMLMDIDPRRTRAVGIWAGGLLSRFPQHSVRVFPWVWTAMSVPQQAPSANRSSPSACQP